MNQPVHPTSRLPVARLANILRGVTFALVAACCAPRPPTATATGAAVGIDLGGIDHTVRPGDEFFLYANGAWVKATEIPADRASWGAGQIVDELTTKRLADLIAEAAHGSSRDADLRKIGDYYASFMDTATIARKGLEPLQPTLAPIGNIADARSLSRVLGSTLRADVDVLNNTNYDTDNLFGLWVAQDLDDPSHYSPFLLQGGLGMPDRDYYLDDSPRMVEIRAAYVKHVAAMLKLAGLLDAEAAATAARIVGLETKIARAHVTRVETESVQKGDNHWTRHDLATRAPGIDWDAFLDAAGLAKQDSFVIWQPAAVTGIAALVRDEPLEVWRQYLTFHAIAHFSDFLPDGFVDEAFAFHGHLLAGTPTLRDRWKRAIDVTNAALGEAVGKVYVAHYFPPPEKARIEALVKNELTAFGARIDKLDWMAPATKQQAKAKLAALKVGVGYPDKWRDYRELDIVRGDALGNAQRAELFEYRRNIHKLGQPVDRGEWVMTPQLVNAVNLPAMNALNFPAAMLQPPYFDPSRPIVMDYGAVGSVIGHEISHSFDDQGAQFDATGRLHNWWTPEDLAHFEASAAKLVAQYNAYRPLPDLSLNGQLTLGENIADVAGLAAAYDAYRSSFGGKEAPTVAGLTGDQQFFLSFAQAWRSKLREQQLRRSILTNGHAPAQYRADTVRNLDAWYPAFDVQPGQHLYLAPADRVHVW